MNSKSDEFKEFFQTQQQQQLHTYPSSVEDSGKHQHDVVGPVLLIDGHLVLFDHQDM